MAERSSGKRKWLAPLSAALLAGLAFFAWNFYWPSGLSSHSPVPPGRNQVYFGPTRSIALLPFELKDAGAGQQFWSVGLSIELTRLLASVDKLTVISPNSALFFKERRVAERVIAERLQATNLLLGRLEFSGEKVRVDLRLFNARRNAEIWSFKNQMEIGELFELQASLLGEIVAAVRAGDTASVPDIEPVDTDAWISYLRGLHHQETRTPEGFLEAEKAFRAAVAIEPGYELARLGLASTLLARSAAGDSDPALVERARAELQAVIRTNPDRPEALGLSSYLSRNHDWDFAAAVIAGEAAVRSNPGDPDLKGIASLAQFSAGRFDRARALKEEAVDQDPLNLAGWIRLGVLQEYDGDYQSALRSYDRVLRLNPDYPGVRALRARTRLIQQKPESALEEAGLESDAFWKRYSEILALTAVGNTAKASELLEQMKDDDGSRAAYQIAEILAFQGDIDGAFGWLEKAYLLRDGGMKELQGNFFLKNLNDDPRWSALLRRLGLPLDLQN